uniref:Fungal lipase-type domain-containing protein n=1 Tax=Physcomitrium patens TaxID=3218 RepID=A0A7I4CAW7_PHYPA
MIFFPDKGDEPTSTASLVDIASSILRSTSGMQIQKWSIADLTLGLYFLSVRHASQMASDTFSGDLVSSDTFVGDLIYYVELARGSYQKDAAGLARVSMIQESKVVKFEDTSNVMRPGYYIAVDHRHKLVILCIRGTHTVHDIITDLASNSGGASNLDGENVHYGSVEAARWFMEHELSTLKSCLHEHEGYELRLVGHSLGGSTAALLALMLRRLGDEQLGFSSQLIKAVTIASPPCVSEKLASECADYITTLVLQDDVIPRMSTAALTRLRNEILVTNWTLLKDSEEHKGIAEFVESTIKKLSSVQDVARRYASFVSLGSSSDSEIEKLEKNVEEVATKLLEKKDKLDDLSLSKREPRSSELSRESKIKDEHPELWVPGLLLLIYGGRTPTDVDQKEFAGREGHVLLKGQDGTQFGRIVLSSTMLSDHKCISIYYALRDVLKGLPKTGGSNKLSI